MRIVVDTSVVVAAVINPGGAAWVLLEVALSESPPVETCMSLALALEYRDVLGRPRVRAKSILSDDEIDMLADGLEAVATRVEIVIPLRPCAPDPGDDFVVELVVNANAERLITYNLRDFTSPAALWGFAVCPPAVLLRELEI